MAPPRAYWQGYLRLSLVSIAVELYSATQSKTRLALHQIHRPSGKRVRYEKIVPGIGPVDTDDIVRGFEIEKDEYVLLKPEELDEIKLESKNVIELVQFVDHCEIDPRFYDKPYYVTPDGDVATEGFVVIREALEKAKKVALGQMAVRGRDYVCSIRPCGSGLLLETLRYADEVRASDPVFAEISAVKPDREMLNLASELIERKAAPFDPRAFHERYAAALRDLIEEKRKKGAISHTEDESPSERSGEKVVDLMEALKKSVARDKRAHLANAKRRSTKRRARG